MLVIENWILHPVDLSLTSRRFSKFVLYSEKQNLKTENSHTIVDYIFDINF